MSASEVQYVWVGPLEREKYDVESLESDPGIEAVSRNDAVTIYQVHHDERVDQPTG